MWKMDPPDQFSLSGGGLASPLIDKVYLDVVSPSGDVCIAYAIDLRWGPLRLSASSVLVAPVDGAVATQTSLGARAWHTDESGVSFDAPALGASGRWSTAGISPIAATLLNSDEGAVHWTCLAPATDASITVGERKISGRGYAERLVMTIEPWKLPIDLLRWGRFIDADASVVWISWCEGRDEQPTRQLVLVDGVRAEAPCVTDREVLWHGGGLSLEPVRTLRDAPFATGPVATVARALPFLPAQYLLSHEKKWLANGRMEQEAGAPRVGTAVHEAVRFQRSGA